MRIDFKDIEPMEQHEFKGGTGTLHIQAADDGQARIQRVVVHPGGSLGLHAHVGNCEVVYVLEGEGKVIDGDEEYRLRPGLVTYCPEGKKHSIINDTGDDLVLFAVIPNFAQEGPQEKFMDLARERCSIRKFSDKAVPQELLDKVLEAAQIAPTAKNLQPWRIHVLRSPEALAKLDALTRIRFGAPLALVFSYDTTEEWQNPLEEGVHSGVEDASIAATHAMLEAADLGLDTVWCNYFPNTRLAESLGLPKSERIVLVMPLGYRAEGAHPAHLHTETKPLDQLVDYL